MKTVTLTDHAYERLASRQLPPLSAKQARTLGKACRCGKTIPLSELRRARGCP